MKERNLSNAMDMQIVLSDLVSALERLDKSDDKDYLILIDHWFFERQDVLGHAKKALEKYQKEIPFEVTYEKVGEKEWNLILNCTGSVGTTETTGKGILDFTKNGNPKTDQPK